MADVALLMCLDCGRPLADAREEPVELRRCACGIAYSNELLVTVDPAEWRRVRDRDGYDVDVVETTAGERSLLVRRTFDGDGHIVTLPPLTPQAADA